MKAASSTTRTRAMSVSFPWGGFERHRVDSDGPFIAVEGHEAPGTEAPSIDIQVDRVLELAIELDDRAGGEVHRPADRHAHAAEPGRDADADTAEQVGVEHVLARLTGR